MSGLFAWLGRLLVALFGQLAWTPPPWLKAIARAFAPLTTRLRAAGVALKRPRNLAIAGGTALLVTAGLVAYALWPKPVEPIKVSVQISRPSPPPPRTAKDPEPRPEPITLRFGGSAAPLHLVDQPVQSGITLTPPTQGAWKWSGDSLLVFTPAHPWPVGQSYEVAIAKDAVAEHVVLDRYDLETATQDFMAQMSEAQFHQDPVDPKAKKVVATVRFNYPVDPESIEKRVKLFLADPQKPTTAAAQRFVVSYDDLKFAAFIHSANIPIPLDDLNMQVIVEKGVRAQAGGTPTPSDLRQEVRVPGRYSLFRIQQTFVTLVRNEQYEPEQVVLLNCTTGVLEGRLAGALEVFLLPKHKPAIQGRKAVKNFYWRDPSIIGAEVLQASKKLTVTPIPAEREYATQHTFKLDTDPGRFLYVRIKKGLEAYGGYLLAKDFAAIAQVPPYPQEVRIMHEGAVLSVSGDRKLNVMTRGLKGARITLNRVLPGELNHLVSQTGGDFKNPQFANYRFNEHNISEVFQEVERLDASDPKKAQYIVADFSKYLAGDGVNRGLFFLHVEAWDPDKNARIEITPASTTHRALSPSQDEGEYEGEGGEGDEGDHAPNGYAGQSFGQGQDRRFILVTDLGVLVKTDAQGNHLVFAQSVKTGEPVSGATVEILGKNGLPLLTREAENGVARFPSLKDFVAEKEPVAYTVRSGDDLSFLPMQRGDRLLNFSRFAVEGVRTGGQPDALAAYLFSDRGIYRPGDTFHIGIVVKAVDWRRPLEGVPLQTTLTDARGIEVKKQRMVLSATGFEELAYTTEENAPTGTYTVNLYIVHDDKRRSFLGSTSVRVEEFLPDRLRITTRIGDKVTDGWLSPEALSARVELRNLFGTPAAGHRISAGMTLAPRYPALRGYGEFVFYDPLRAERGFSERLSDTQTDGEGNASFPLDLSRFAKATYQLSLLAEGFELDGGRGVSAEASVMVSPLKYLIGYKPEGDLSFVKKGAELGVKVIAVGPDLSGVAVDKLSAVLIEERWVSVLVRQPSGTYAYQSVRKELTRKMESLAIAAQGTRLKLPTTDTGDYVISIRDAADTELNRVRFTVAGPAPLARELERNAELQVLLDRRDYKVGDTITLQIKAPYTGAGLITIERDRVYTHKWFKSDSPTTVQTITVPEGVEANGYVNVAFLRALDSPEIYMSPLSYGVVPFTVSRAQRTVSIDLEQPELGRPGEPFKVSYRTDRPSRLVLFGVDEGILQVAGYQTPDPVSFFLSKRALEVVTRQILDLVLPEFSVVAQLSKTGGDDGEAALAKNLNPFRRKTDKPVVFWSGIIDAGPDTKTYTYKVPDYFNGTLRVMAVAVAPDALGAASKKSFVRGPFVLNPNTPLFVGPEDVFEASVAVANNVEKSGAGAKVEVTLETSPGLLVEGAKSQEVTIPEGREMPVRFKVRAQPILGNAELTFRAKTGKQTSKFTTTTSVRPPAPYFTTTRGGSLKSGAKEIAVERRMYSNYRKLTVSVSPLPLGLARGLIDYLDKFPYECTEQLVSRSVPLVVLSGRPEFGMKAKDAKQAVASTLQVLQARQNSEGAFGFWAANSYVSDYQTVYVMHFLTEANERDFAVAADLRARGLQYVRTVTRKPLRSLSDARLRAYAIYVLTRNRELASAELAELRQFLGSRQEPWKNDTLALYLAASYELMRDTAEALKLIRVAEATGEVQQDEATFYDANTYPAQVLYILAKHFPERLRDVDAEVLERLVGALERGGFNTIASAYAIYGLDAYAKATSGEAGKAVLKDVRIEEVQDPGQTLVALKLGEGLFPVIAFSDKAKAIRITSKSALPVFYTVTAAGFDLAPPTAKLADKIEIIHTYTSTSGGEVSSAELGDEVNVHIKVRAVDGGTHRNVAVVDLLPAGFDVVLARGADLGVTGRIAAQGTTWQPDYADVREDRVVLYGTVGERVQQLVYKMKAVSRGTFVVPPTLGEGMYDRSVQARSLGGALAVRGN